MRRCSLFSGRAFPPRWPRASYRQFHLCLLPMGSLSPLWTTFLHPDLVSSRPYFFLKHSSCLTDGSHRRLPQSCGRGASRRGVGLKKSCGDSEPPLSRRVVPPDRRQSHPAVALAAVPTLQVFDVAVGRHPAETRSFGAIDRRARTDTRRSLNRAARGLRRERRRTAAWRHRVPDTFSRTHVCVGGQSATIVR